MAVTKQDPRIKKLLKTAQQDNTEHEKRVLDANSKWIKKQLNQKSIVGVAAGMLSLGEIAHNRGIRQLLLQGHTGADAPGWTMVEQGAIYHWWMRRAGAKTTMTHAGNLLGLLLALEEWELADWLAQRLIESADSITMQGWNDKTHQFPRYALRLWAKLRNTTITVDGADLPTDHVYHRMLERWDTPAAISELLNEAAEYHLANTWLDEQGCPEFQQVSAFPVSLAATIVVRRALGLETVRSPHPIDVLPGANGIPPRAERQRCRTFDPLFMQLLTLAQKSGIELPQEHVAFLGAASGGQK